MSFRKPISTMGGLNFWKNIKQNQHFIMQEHKVGVPVWPYKYRILMRANSMEIANANDYSEIKHDWKFLGDNAVPQLDKKIDLAEKSDEIFGVVEFVTKIISKKR